MIPSECPLCDAALVEHSETSAVMVCHECRVAFTNSPDDVPGELKGLFTEFLGVSDGDEVGSLGDAVKHLMKDPLGVKEALESAAAKAFDLDTEDSIEKSVLRLLHEYNIASRDYLMVLLKLQHYATGLPVSGEAARDALEGRISKMIDIQNGVTLNKEIEGNPSTHPRAPYRLILEMVRACHNETLCYIHEIEDDSHKADSARFN